MRATLLCLLVLGTALACDSDIGGTSVTDGPDAGVVEPAPAPDPVADPADAPPDEPIEPPPATTTLQVSPARGAVNVDGDLSEFLGAQPVNLTIAESGATAVYRILWDAEALYIGVDASDANLFSDNTIDGSLWRDDGLEILFDTLHDRGTTRGLDDYKFFLNLDNSQGSAQASSGSYPTAIPFESAIGLRGTLGDPQDTDDGYTVEVKVLWSDWGVPPPVAGQVWGFDIKFNDDIDGATRYSTSWRNTVDSVNTPDGWGELAF